VGKYLGNKFMAVGFFINKVIMFGKPMLNGLNVFYNRIATITKIFKNNYNGTASTLLIAI
jgi:hypothetical protein